MSCRGERDGSDGGKERTNIRDFARGRGFGGQTRTRGWLDPREEGTDFFILVFWLSKKTAAISMGPALSRERAASRQSSQRELGAYECGVSIPRAAPALRYNVIVDGALPSLGDSRGCVIKGCPSRRFSLLRDSCYPGCSLHYDGTILLGVAEEWLRALGCRKLVLGAGIGFVCENGLADESNCREEVEAGALAVCTGTRLGVDRGCNFGIHG
ncbi:hypothetical protein QAD02_018441 [Eretmocerus hayati]|uniref:Uncharacterized protein n=1 Tax=Eretmocerus hayati TaxID=131215 RepID=A0ACC2PH65_9HYME|nr:hypothetical protein QAD02_018441 [Eretmocerus hayati]